MTEKIVRIIQLILLEEIKHLSAQKSREIAERIVKELGEAR